MIFLNLKIPTPLVAEHKAGHVEAGSVTQVYFEMCFEESQVAINLLNLQKLWEEEIG